MYGLGKEYIHSYRLDLPLQVIFPTHVLKQIYKEDRPGNLLGDMLLKNITSVKIILPMILGQYHRLKNLPSDI